MFMAHCGLQVVRTGKMYHGPEKKKKVNPKQNANFLSRITFFFTRDLFQKGFKKDINGGDIYEVVPKFHSTKIGDKLEKEWAIEKLKRRDPSIYRLLWACYGKYYLFWGIIQLFVKIINVLIQPRALGKLVSYFTTKSTLTRIDAIYYAVLVLGLNFIHCTFAHNYQLILTELGIKVKMAFCSLLYRKALKLSPSALSEISIGNIVTLISKDVQIFETVFIFLNDMWISVVILFITTFLIYTRFGVATFAGLGFLLLVVPLQIYAGRLTSQLRIKASKITDERLQSTQETLSAIKIIKMYTWQNFFAEKISKTREEEVSKLRQIYYTKAISLVIGGLVTNITLYLIIVTFTGIGNSLTAEAAFFLMGCIHALRSTVTISIPVGIIHTAELVASAKRIKKVLIAKEIKKPTRILDNLKPIIRVYLDNITVKIKEKVILHAVNLDINSGINLITGKLGGGKSSLLKTILEDYPLSNGHLFVEGQVSYASEEPWLFPSSIRQNILFGQDFDEKRYEKVLEVCALKQDINTFERGDETLVDDRGMNLSKGQKARINLARAVYKDSDIYLFDECLSSLDAQIEEFVFKECIKKFLKGKIVLMISHNERHVKEADSIIFMEDCTIKYVAKPSELRAEEIIKIIQEDEAEDHPDIIDKIDLQEEENVIDESAPLIKTKPTDNMYYEEKKEGGVDFGIYKQYCRYGGGFLVFGLICTLFLFSEIVTIVFKKAVTDWINVEQKISDYKFNNSINATKYDELLRTDKQILTKFTVAIVLTTLFLLLRAYAHFRFCSRASVKLHKSMLFSIVNATMQFFDLQYVGNILNRFSKDLGSIDEYLPFVIYECLRLVCTLGGIVILIVSVNVMFLFPVCALLICLFLIGKYYLPTGRSLKRLEAATRSPILGHVNASLEGLSTIRAFDTQRILENEFEKHLNFYTSTLHMLQCASRAFAYSLDMLCNVFIACIVIRFLIFDKDTLAANVGLAITQSLALIGLLQWGVRQLAELEIQSTAVERILEYRDVQSENHSGQELKNWPTSGKIIYENVYLTYGNSKENILRNINFTIQSGEKIGIVGRTGAGKSSITSILFRLYPYEGVITVDNVNISTLSIDVLRSRIAIIPQDPVLFSGTIRRNIDPTNSYTDEDIWKALEAVEIRNQFNALNDEIVEAGSNFSAGQRQLICLARALITKNQIVILDEATANMDPETDRLIHDTIQNNFFNCTVITIAHRLSTVMNSDRVMVVDKGKVVEFDPPKQLLDKDDGIFYKMANRAKLL